MQRGYHGKTNYSVMMMSRLLRWKGCEYLRAELTAGLPNPDVSTSNAELIASADDTDNAASEIM